MLDVVGVDWNTGQVTVFLATSATAYAAGVLYTTPDGYYGVNSAALGDLNNDGKPEIVTATWMGNIAVHVNNGDGSFQPAVYYEAASSGADDVPGWTYPTAVTIADVNGDGNADIVSSNAYSGDVTILLGNGDGTLNVPTFGYAVGGGADGDSQAAAVVADFDGDGSADIVVPDYALSLAFLKGYNDGTFRSALNYYAPTAHNQWAGTVGLASADFNGDGISDIVIGSESNWGEDSNIPGLTVFLSRPDGSLKPGVTYGTSDCYWFVAVADFDKDGHPTLQPRITAPENYRSSKGKRMARSSPDLRSQPMYRICSPVIWPWLLAVADVNNDGTKDLVVANDAFSGVTVLLNTAGSGSKANYAVKVDSDSQIAKAGSSATFNFTMTPSNHYDGTITFTCGGLPDKATCTFNPTSVAMDGHTPETVQLTIATRATTSTAALRRNSSIMLAATLSGFGLFGMVMLGSLPKRRRLAGIMLGIVMLIMMISLVACGGSSSKTPVTTTIPGTPAGTYAITVTATGTAGSYGGDTSDHPMAVTLTVQ